MNSPDVSQLARRLLPQRLALESACSAESPGPGGPGASSGRLAAVRRSEVDFESPGLTTSKAACSSPIEPVAPWTLESARVFGSARTMTRSGALRREQSQRGCGSSPRLEGGGKAVVESPWLRSYNESSSLSGGRLLGPWPGLGDRRWSGSAAAQCSVRSSHPRHITS